MIINEKKYSASTLLFSGVVAYAFGYATHYYIQKRKDYIDAQYEEELDTLYNVDELLNLYNHDPDQLELDLKHAEYDNTVILVDNVPYDINSNKNNPENIVVENQPNLTNIFDGDSYSDWDYGFEISQRSLDKPYIIHQDEYFGKETEYTQSTLTYYAADDILVDEKEVPIYNYKSVTGELRFGHGSDDQNVVYIRNDRLSGEYEVIRDSGSYEVEVLGNQYEQALKNIDLKNSVLKFRPE
mgnify:FL=1